MSRKRNATKKLKRRRKIVREIEASYDRAASLERLTDQKYEVEFAPLQFLDNDRDAEGHLYNAYSHPTKGDLPDMITLDDRGESLEQQLIDGLLHASDYFRCLAWHLEDQIALKNSDVPKLSSRRYGVVIHDRNAGTTATPCDALFSPMSAFEVAETFNDKQRSDPDTSAVARVVLQEEAVSEAAA